MEKEKKGLYENIKGRERAVLVALCDKSEKAESIDENLDELQQLAGTAGADVLGRFIQHKDLPKKGTLIGKGKIDEVRQFCIDNDIETVIFDNELSGIQIKNLEDEIDRKILDRSTLILDIFANRAVSAEGKLQVELAQLKYNLPRLVGKVKGLDKMRNGIGMRGPGEKKLEIDRRVIREEVSELEQKIKKLEKERDVRRKKLESSGMKKVALVGYTNAGKSTLMNALAKSSEYVEDKLFATLDPVTRKVFAGGKYYTLTDTVGFINKLPHEFIDAFKSTLEEARRADLLLHVMDLNSPNLKKHYEVVLDVLRQMGVENKPIITVYNKIDALTQPEVFYPAAENSVHMSASRGDGLEVLKEMIQSILFKRE